MNNNKLLIPLTALSLGALGYLGYYLNYKKKKFNVEDLRELTKKMFESASKLELKDLRLNLGKLLQYDWNTTDLKNYDHRELFYLILKDIIYYLSNFFGEKQDEALMLIEFCIEKINELMMMKEVPAKEKEMTYPTIIIIISVLSSRKFNQYFKYNQKLVELMKKQWIVIENHLSKRRLINFSLDMKIMLRKSVIKQLMMRGKYDEVVEKHVSQISNVNFQKMLFRPLTDCYDLIHLLLNATFKSINSPEELKERVKTFSKNLVMELSKLTPISMFSFSSGPYDFYFDSISEEIGPEGLFSRVLFGVFKHGVPIDCKLKIKTIDEKTTLFEEIVKKKSVPKEILNKERLVSRKVFAGFQKNSFNQQLATLSKSNESDDLKNCLIEDSLESTFPFLNTCSSHLLLESDAYFYCIEIDEGQGFKEEGRFLVKKQINSVSSKLGAIFKELGWLPKENCSFLVHLLDLTIKKLDIFHSLDPSKIKIFLEKKGLEEISKVTSADLKPYFYISYMFQIVYQFCYVTENEELFSKISEKTIKMKQSSGIFNVWGFNTEICMYQGFLKYYMEHEMFDKADEYAHQILLQDQSSMCVGDNEFSALMQAIQFLTEQAHLKGSLGEALLGLGNMHKTLEENRQKYSHKWTETEGAICTNQFNVYFYLTALSFCSEGDFFNAEKTMLENILLTDNMVTRNAVVLGLFMDQRLYQEINIEKSRSILSTRMQKQAEILERELETFHKELEASVNLDQITEHHFICANHFAMYGQHEKSIEHLNKIKEIGDLNNTVSFTSSSHNCFFSFFRTSFVRDSLEKYSADLCLKLNVCFKFLDKKDTFLKEGDLIKFALVPFSKVDLLKNDLSELDNLSKEDPSITYFTTKVEKVNTVFCNNIFERILTVKQKVKLLNDESTYLIKAEAYHGDTLISINFSFSHLMDTDLKEYTSFFENYDFFTFMKKLDR